MFSNFSYSLSSPSTSTSPQPAPTLSTNYEYACSLLTFIQLLRQNPRPARRNPKQPLSTSSHSPNASFSPSSMGTPLTSGGGMGTNANHTNSLNNANAIFQLGNIQLKNRHGTPYLPFPPTDDLQTQRGPKSLCLSIISDTAQSLPLGLGYGGGAAGMSQSQIASAHYTAASGMMGGEGGGASYASRRHHSGLSNSSFGSNSGDGAAAAAIAAACLASQRGSGGSRGGFTSIVDAGAEYCASGQQQQHLLSSKNPALAKLLVLETWTVESFSNVPLSSSSGGPAGAGTRRGTAAPAAATRAQIAGLCRQLCTHSALHDLPEDVHRSCSLHVHTTNEANCNNNGNINRARNSSTPPTALPAASSHTPMSHNNSLLLLGSRGGGGGNSQRRHHTDAMAEDTFDDYRGGGASSQGQGNPTNFGSFASGVDGSISPQPHHSLERVWRIMTADNTPCIMLTWRFNEEAVRFAQLSPILQQQHLQQALLAAQQQQQQAVQLLRSSFAGSPSPQPQSFASTTSHLLPNLSFGAGGNAQQGTSKNQSTNQYVNNTDSFFTNNASFVSGNFTQTSMATYSGVSPTASGAHQTTPATAASSPQRSSSLSQPRLVGGVRLDDETSLSEGTRRDTTGALLVRSQPPVAYPSVGARGGTISPSSSLSPCQSSNTILSTSGGGVRGGGGTAHHRGSDGVGTASTTCGSSKFPSPPPLEAGHRPLSLTTPTPQQTPSPQSHPHSLRATCDELDPTSADLRVTSPLEQTHEHESSSLGGGGISAQRLEAVGNRGNYAQMQHYHHSTEHSIPNQPSFVRSQPHHSVQHSFIGVGSTVSQPQQVGVGVGGGGGGGGGGSTALLFNLIAGCERLTSNTTPQPSPMRLGANTRETAYAVKVRMRGEGIRKAKATEDTQRTKIDEQTHRDQTKTSLDAPSGTSASACHKYCRARLYGVGEDGRSPPLADAVDIYKVSVAKARKITKRVETLVRDERRKQTGF